ncbi:MAG: beta-phosphoglucomutase [Clostridiales bacterium]|nr:beta-phosphoglucomutase [Clostridiales bacterium]
MKYKAIIFDLDGVIVHTDNYHYIAWKSIADELGAYFDEEINNRLRGVSRMESLEILLEGYDGKLSTTEKQMLAHDKNETYKKLLASLTPAAVDPEISLTLAELREKEIKLAIGSSSKNAVLILERIGLLDAFDAISDGNNITRSKPDPEVFTKAAKYLGVSAADCLVVEDAVSGIEAAKAAGMDAAAIGDAVRSSCADYVLDKVRDILKLVD